MSGILQNTLSHGTITNPNLIPNLNLWYDAAVSNASYIQNSSGTAPTDNQQVKSWIDKLGFGRNSDQASSNRQPLWKANQSNGQGAILFDGSNDTFTLNPIPWSLSLSGQTTYVVFKATSLVDQMHLQATNTGGYSFYLNGSNWAVETAGGIATSDSGSDTTKFHCIGMIFDGTQTNANQTTQNNLRIKCRYDGIQRSLTFSANANATTSASANTLNIAANDAGNANYFSGYIGEIMIWTRTLTISEAIQVESYLKTKWAI